MSTTPPLVFLTIDEVAELLRIPVATLRDWRTDRKGPPAYKFGAGLRYERRELLAWIESRRVAGDKPTPAARPLRLTG